jgi:UDP-N-acetylglucosamine acyltransferase
MATSDAVVHPSAVVHPGARLGRGVQIGPGCVVGEFVRIGRGTRLDAHVCIQGHVLIGEDNRFSPSSVIGGPPQDVSYDGEETRVEIGERNIFREFMTVHRGSAKGSGVTRIGNDNYFMAYAHIAHDCSVGGKTVLMNGVTLGGHVEVLDFAQISAFTGIHQFCRIGRYAFIGGFSVLTQDVLPFCKVAGFRPTRLYGMNAIGLRRNGFDRERIQAIKGMLKLIFYSQLNTSQALERIETEFPESLDRAEIFDFIRGSKRGIVKKSAEE